MIYFETLLYFHLILCLNLDQEAAAMAATEVLFMLQSGQERTFQFTIAPDSPTTPQQEPHE